MSILEENLKILEETDISFVIGRNSLVRKGTSKTFEQNVFFLVRKQDARIMKITAKPSCDNFEMYCDVALKAHSYVTTYELALLETVFTGDLPKDKVLDLAESMKNIIKI